MSKKKSSSLKKIRLQAYKAQSGLCYYCSQPMWEDDIKFFISHYKVSQSQAKLLKSTAEHLKARQDGGNNYSSNIVAACQYCNNTRHKAKNALSPSNYKQRVTNRLLQNKWHQIYLNNQSNKALN